MSNPRNNGTIKRKICPLDCHRKVTPNCLTVKLTSASNQITFVYNQIMKQRKSRAFNPITVGGVRNRPIIKKFMKIGGRLKCGPQKFSDLIFWIFLKTQFFSHFWPPNELLVFIESKPLMSRSFWVYLQPSRCFLWEVVVVWSSDARKSWKFPILQISQNMTKLEIYNDTISYQWWSFIPRLDFDHNDNFFIRVMKFH